MSKYVVKRITVKEAKEVTQRLTHLRPNYPAQFAYGLFREGELVGAAAFGRTASPNLDRGLCGEEYKDEVIELKRIYVDKSVSKGAAKFFLNTVCRKVPRKIVVAFSRIGNLKSVPTYCSAGFVYTGLTKKRKNRVNVDGSEGLHNRHSCYDKVNTILVERPRKHRFVWLEDEELKSKLRYDTYPPEYAEYFSQKVKMCHV